MKLRCSRKGSARISSAVGVSVATMLPRLSSDAPLCSEGLPRFFLACRSRLEWTLVAVLCNPQDKMAVSTDKDTDNVSAKIDVVEMSEKGTSNMESPSVGEFFTHGSETFNQSKELINKVLADNSETPSHGNETSGDEIHQATETSGSELLQQLKSIGEANTELLQQLVKDFDVKFKYDAAKQEQIDKLYKENTEFKEGILDKFKRSLILAVIEQIDSAEKSIAFFGNKDKECSEENYRKLLSNFRDIVREWQDMLLQQFDVSSYRCEPNSPIDIRRQRILKQIPTGDTGLYKHVHRTLRPGYELDGQVLRPELVEVFVKQ